MRILIPLKVEPSVENNPFVNVLSEGLTNYGHEVICSREEFWENPGQYDLIFFQWPDWVLLDDQKSSKDINSLRAHLKAIRDKCIPLVVTVHNLHPHDNNPFTKEIYETIYGNVDAFHHMGKFSYNYLKAIYPNKFHFIVPHPIYYELNDLTLTRKDCKRKFQLPVNRPTILAFGAFRNKDERKLFISLSHHFYFRATFWAPKFNRFQEERSLIGRLLTRLKYRINGIRMIRGPITDTDVQQIIQASDIMFIQRLDILNSGNLPLGFAGSNIVVGPNLGNVGEILRSTGNPVFDPSDKESIFLAIEDALRMFKLNTNQGKKNFDYAMSHWNKGCVTQMLNEKLSMI